MMHNLDDLFTPESKHRPVSKCSEFLLSYNSIFPSIALCSLFVHCDVPFATSSVGRSFSGPNDMGSSASRGMTTDLPSLSYIMMGQLGCNKRVSQRSIALLLSEKEAEMLSYLAKLPDELSAHAARTRGWADISRNCYCSNITFPCSLNVVISML